jgi:hypothetical protein
MNGLTPAWSARQPAFHRIGWFGLATVLLGAASLPAARNFGRSILTGPFHLAT